MESQRNATFWDAVSYSGIGRSMRFVTMEAPTAAW
jgi:hypothetical protein